jgi:hypothetical protein
MPGPGVRTGCDVRSFYMGNYPPGPMAAAPGHQEGLPPAGALPVITLCDSHGLAKTVIGRPLMAPPHPPG